MAPRIPDAQQGPTHRGRGATAAAAAPSASRTPSGSTADTANARSNDALPAADKQPLLKHPEQYNPNTDPDLFPTLDMESELWTAVKGFAMVLQGILGMFIVTHMPWFVLPLGWSLIGAAVIYGVNPLCAFAAYLRDQAMALVTRNEQHMAARALRLSHLNWLHLPLLAVTPILSVYALFTVPVYWQTVIWAAFYYVFTGLGITAGYHRLWAHRAYKAPFLTRFLLLAGGTGAVEGSVRWWCRDHRAHHRYVDTPQDPYAATRGMFYSHVGWMLFKQKPNQIGRVQIPDLNEEAMIRFQHKFYLPLAIFWAFVFPSVVAGQLWGDYLGGFFYAGVLRLTLVHHNTFCINSLAHYLGDHPFSERHTARDSFITSLLTFGEGYHNFHHTYPNDYRNGVEDHHYDPTKWLIALLSHVGLTYDLHRFEDNEINKARINQKQRDLDRERARVNWGPAVDALPVWSREHVRSLVDHYGRQLVIIDGFVHDVSNFINEHPGGPNMIKTVLGSDATAQFTGQVYNHSDAGHNLLLKLRVARVQ